MTALIRLSVSNIPPMIRSAEGFTMSQPYGNWSMVTNPCSLHLSLLTRIMIDMLVNVFPTQLGNIQICKHLTDCMVLVLLSYCH